MRPSVRRPSMFPQTWCKASSPAAKRRSARATEATEDDPESGTTGPAGAGFGKHDVLVGIAASGRTPYVLGAISKARELGALDDRDQLHAGFGVGPGRRYRDYTAAGPGSDHRVDPDEGRDRDQAGPEHDHARRR